MPLTMEQQLHLFRNLVRAMTLDQLMMRMIQTGRLVGFYHEGGIALAPGVAAASFLRQSDCLWPHYRSHGVAHMASKGIDTASYFAEHMGRSDGCCKGRSSFHCSYPEHHVHGFSGNIGANFPLSIGYGFAAKYKKTDNIVMSCSGDGSYGEGRSHEALLMAANWRLPIIFWCENNGISQHTAMTEIFPGNRVSALAAGYGIPARVVDGQDVFACGEAALDAIDHARSGKGPMFVECITLRSQEHAIGGVNKAGTTVREPDLMAEWKKTSDPQKLAAARLIGTKVATEADVKAIVAAAAKEAEEIESFCDRSPKATPSVEVLVRGLYAA